MKSIIALATVALTMMIGNDATACSGCGCRGGPGWRKANGQCASWADGGGSRYSTTTPAPKSNYAPAVHKTVAAPKKKNAFDEFDDAARKLEELNRKYDSPFIVPEKNGKLAIEHDCTYIEKDNNFACVFKSYILWESYGVCRQIVTNVFARILTPDPEQEDTILSIFIPENGNAMPLSDAKDCQEKQILSITKKDNETIMLFGVFTLNGDGNTCRKPVINLFASSDKSTVMLPVTCKHFMW